MCENPSDITHHHIQYLEISQGGMIYSSLH